MLTEVLAALALHLAGWGLLRHPRMGLSPWMIVVFAFPVGLAALSVPLGVAFVLHLPFMPMATTATVLGLAGACAWRGNVPVRRGEAIALLAGLMGSACVAAISVVLGTAAAGEDSRWFLSIGQQIVTFGGMADSLKGQLGTRPFLLPLLIAVGEAAGHGYPAFLGPLCGLHTVLAVLAFGHRLSPGPASQTSLPLRLIPGVLALVLATSAPFIWSTAYLGPHALFLLFFTVATGSAAVTAAGGGTHWLILFAAGSMALSMTRVEGSLTAAPLLVALLSACSIPMAERVRTLVTVGAFQAVWHALVLASSKGYGGLRASEIIIFGAIPGAVALAALLLKSLEPRRPALAYGLAEWMPRLMLAGLMGALVLHESILPWSTLRALPITAHFLFASPSGFAVPILMAALTFALCARRARSRPARLVETTIAGHVLIVLLIAAHSPHQDPNIIDSTDRMLLHVLPMLFLYPWLCLAPIWSRTSPGEPLSAARSIPFRRTILAGLVLVATGLSVWLVKERYFLRMVPIPSALFMLLENSPDIALPFVPATAPALPDFDLDSDESLRAAIAFVRGWSPVAGAQVPFGGTATREWLDFLRDTPLYCTDASQMMMLLAARHGYPVREVHLYATPGQQNGNAHTVMEFWSPRRGRWIGVDAQTATLYRNGMNGSLMSVTEAITARAVHFERVVPKVAALRGLDPELLLRAGAKAAVISQIVPPWLGERRPSIPLGYALMVNDQTHEPRILRTKQAAALLLLVLLALFVLGRNPVNSPGRS